MKAGTILTAAVGVTLLFSSNAFAARQKPNTKGTLHLSEEVTVEGKQLAPGDYKVKTEDNGWQTMVNIMNGKETIVSVPAQTKPADINQSHAYMTTDEPNGTKELTAVYLKGTEYEFFDHQNAPEPSSQ
jgi:hypothetical protein